MTVASPPTKAEPKQMVGLPVLISSPTDVIRLARELEKIDETLLQLGLRKNGDEVKLPKTSKLMDQMVDLNKLNLLQPADRQILREFLAMVSDKAPVLTISFSADPSVAFLEKLLAWLRREIHPLVLVRVGLQPNIGAGCIVRSTNKQFDLSLKQDFLKHSDLLQQAMTPPEPQPQSPAQPAPQEAAA